MLGALEMESAKKTHGYSCLVDHARYTNYLQYIVDTLANAIYTLHRRKEVA